MTQIPDAALKQEAWSSILHLLMKHAFNRDVLSLVENLLATLRTIKQEGGRGYIQEAFNYLLNTANETPGPRAFIHRLKSQLSFETREGIVTIAEQLEAIGREKGRQEGVALAKQREARGREEEKKSIALKLLQQGMSTEQVTHITQLPITTVEKLPTVTSH